jgi:septal ring factor EnvC (AmiA/AmiB activator)
VDETNLDELRKELASLEAAETKISAERRRLHDKIDYGFADEATQAREREVSDERQQLHQRIDALRELLGDGEQDPATADAPLSPFSQWSGISAEAPADEAGT